MSASKIVLNILYVCTTILLFIVVAFSLLKLGATSYSMGYRVFTEQPVERSPGRDVVVEVAEGVSARELGVILEEKGLVKDANLFLIQMKLFSYPNKVRPGLYTLNTSQTAKDMLAVMTAKQVKEEGKEDGGASK